MEIWHRIRHYYVIMIYGVRNAMHIYIYIYNFFSLACYSSDIARTLRGPCGKIVLAGHGVPEVWSPFGSYLRRKHRQVRSCLIWHWTLKVESRDWLSLCYYTMTGWEIRYVLFLMTHCCHTLYKTKNVEIVLPLRCPSRLNTISKNDCFLDLCFVLLLSLWWLLQCVLSGNSYMTIGN